MSTQPIDYAALAAQARQQSTPKVDYAALAEQARTGGAKPDPNAWRNQFSAEELKHLDNPSFMDRVKRIIPGTTPYQMATAQEQSQHPNGLPGSFEGHPENIGEYVPATAGRAVEGAVDMSRGNIAMGAHKMVQAAGNTVAPMTPILVAGAPVAAARAMIGGAAVGKVAGVGAQALGATKDQASVAEDAGNLIGGTAAATGAARALLETPTKVLLAKNKANLEGALDLIFSPKETLKAKLGSMAKEVLSPAEAPTAAASVPGANDPAPAPYRMSGSQIQDATTVTPRRILGPDRQLPAAPEQTAATQAATPAAPPATAKVLKDAGVTQAMKDAGVAAPGASIRPVRPGVTGDLYPRSDISFPSGLSGQDAANMQLTRYNINELRFMAQKRGLPVSPQATHTDLIGKLSESLTPSEVQGFATAAAQSKPVVSKFPENNQMAQNLNQAASALQESKGSPYEVASLRSAASTIANHPANISEVDLTANKIKGVDKRIGKRINEFFAAQKTPDQAPVPLPETSAQTPQVPTGPEHMMELLRQSLAARAGK